MGSELTPLGDSALVLRVGDSLGEVLALARQLEAAHLGGALEVVPAVASVAVFFESPTALENCRAAVESLLRGRNPAIEKRATAGRVMQIPVCYAPSCGLDFAAVTRHTGLSPNEIAHCHSRGRYEVRCVGFTPGFPYLSGLSRALATPRRPTPRMKVPPGSVAIAGAQTGIYPLASPGGWNVIGRTPLALFDAAREPAALLAAGDRVQFVPISEKDFLRWEK